MGFLKALDGALVVAAALLTGTLVWAFLSRVGHPFDLEWMEGGMLAHAWRLQRGLALYPEPGPDWIPYVYPPGYAAVLAGLSNFVELGYPLGRSISIVGSLAAAGALVHLVAKRGSLPLGLAAGAAFLGCWRASGAFYDLVRPDGLAMGLAAWSLVFAADRRKGSDVVAGLLLCAAFLVKHNLAALGLPMVLALGSRDGVRPAARFLIASAAPALLLVAAFQAVTEGRWLRYLVDVPTSHPIQWSRVWPGTPGEIATWLMPATVVATIGLLAALPSSRLGVRRELMHVVPGVAAVAAGAAAYSASAVPGVPMSTGALLVITSACLAAAAAAGPVHALAALAARVLDTRWWFAFGCGATLLFLAGWMRGHNGGFMNVLMPVHWALCAGMGLAAVATTRPGSAILARLAVLVQLAWIGAQLEVREVLPTASDVVGGEEVVERLVRCEPGPILSPYAAWLPVQAGRAPSPHLIAMWDIHHPDGPFRDGVPRFVSAARAHHWTCVVHGGRQPLGFGVEAAYAADGVLDLPVGAMMPKTGWRVRPATVLLPKE